MPAFELIEDRGADYSNLFFLGVAADNSWNGGIVLGEPVIDWQGIDLVAATGNMTINGQPAGEGKGGDVLGHPLEALAWLANNLAERGQSLKKDMIVMTGSIVSTKFLNKGDEVGFVIDTLGEVKLTVA
jgi:2-keto-4-pentenoate hydratase